MYASFLLFCFQIVLIKKQHIQGRFEIEPFNMYQSPICKDTKLFKVAMLKQQYSIEMYCGRRQIYTYSDHLVIEF